MMTLQTLTQKVPSIFTASPAPKVSDKYTFVPTFEILENFEREGWKVSTARQMGKSNFSQHEVRLRNGALPKVGDSILEAVIKNSHNGLTSFSISSGLYRLVCSNGLTVPTSVVDTISLKHMRIDLGMVRQITDEFAERLPVIERSVNRMESTSLSDGQIVDMVQKSTMIRWEKGNIPMNLKIEDILQPEREEDKGNTVWKTFNIIQEKFVRGGIQYKTNKGRFMTMKELKNFQNVNKINTKLWELAESYCN